MDGAIPTAGSSSSTAAEERSPLLPTALSAPSSPDSARPARPTRNVTFNPHVLTKTIESTPSYQAIKASQSSSSPSPFGPPSPSAISTGGLGGGPQMLSAFNNKLRRRNSHGSPNTVQSPGAPGSFLLAHQPKIGPQRSTKNAQKLKLLPNPEPEEDEDEESGRDVYSQYTRIKDPTARRDAARLGKADRDRLPRVTAYCTANRYQTNDLMRFLKGRGRTRGANPKLIDECIYTPYSYSPKQAEQSRERQAEAHASFVAEHERRHSTGELLHSSDSTGYHPDDLVSLSDSIHSNGSSSQQHHDHHDDSLAVVDDSMPEFDITVHMPEIFLFDYGVVVIWGMSAAHEQRFLKELAKFETEKLAPDDVETEFFNFYYTHEYQARIYNDFITLRDKNNYMTKLAISHALAQSVKVPPPPPPIPSPTNPNLTHPPRPPSSKNSSPRPSTRAKTSPRKSRSPEKSTSAGPKSTCRSASSSSCASTSISTARCWTRPSCSGSSRSSSPSTRPCAATWRWTSAWAC